MKGCSALGAVRASFFAPAVAAALLWSWSPAVALAATKHTAPSPRRPFAYNTSGVVSVAADPSSVSGPAVLQFEGVTGASFDPRSGRPIDLGRFVAAPSSVVDGETTSFTGTPFEVQVQAPEFNKSSSVPVLAKLFPAFGKNLRLKTVVENSLLLRGHLDGVVGPNGQANVTATVDSIKLGSRNVRSQDHVTHYTFPIRYNQLKLPASWVMGTTPASRAQVPPGRQVAQAQAVTPSPMDATMTTIGSVRPIPASASFAATPTPVPTPEPSTILLFATAFAGLFAARRRKSR